MGYDLHVTRADAWFDSGESPITLTEWYSYIQSDVEMQLHGYAEAAMLTGETLRYKSEGLAVWTAYSGHEADGNMAWFDYRDGEIVVKNPDEEIIGKTCRIARSLNARVQGDDLEFYDESTLANKSPASGSKRWWKRLWRR